MPRAKVTPPVPNSLEPWLPTSVLDPEDRKLLERWLPEATALDAVHTSFNPPLPVLLDEAVAVARFARRYWNPSQAAAPEHSRPGLVCAGACLPQGIADELLELREAVQLCQKSSVFVELPNLRDGLARARHLRGELSSIVHWWANANTNKTVLKQLHSLEKAHANGSKSRNELAAELADYAELSRLHAKHLDGLGGFDAMLIGEAIHLVKQLRERPGEREARLQHQRAIELRNRLATLLHERMHRVRAAARFVFRDFPEIARKAGSVYGRKRRAMLRKGPAAGHFARRKKTPKPPVRR